MLFTLKVHCLILRIELSYSNDIPSPNKSCFHISFKSVKSFGYEKRLHMLQSPILYCVSLTMVTMTGHIFMNIAQIVHFSAVKFTKGNEQNMSLAPNLEDVCEMCL